VIARSTRDESAMSSRDEGFLPALKKHGIKLDDHVLASMAEGRGRRKGLVWFAALMGISLAVILLVMSLPYVAVLLVDFLPRSVDQQLGDATAAQVQLGADVSDQTVTAAVHAIEARLEENVDANGFKFEVRVVDNALVNAFALPGGTILITTGLLECAERPEQVAGVMAHEMAHVTLRHGLRSFMRGAGFIVMIRLFFGDEDSVANIMAQGAAVALILGHSREHESAADMEALRTMHAAALDGGALREMLVTMEMKAGSPSVDIPEWASTHPNVRSRADAIDAAVAAQEPRESRRIDLDWAAVIGALRKHRRGQ
jgi:predicted Zn-dependent protease